MYQAKGDYEKAIYDLNNKIDELENHNTSINESYKFRMEEEIHKNKNNSNFIEELKKEVETLVRENKELNNKASLLEKEGEGKNNIILNTNKKIRKLFAFFHQEVTDRSNKLTKQISILRENLMLNSENIRFIRKLGIKEQNINNVIYRLKDVITSKSRENTILEREVHDASNILKRGSARTISLFQEQIKEAMNELNICRDYLEKKSKEIKDLKNENSRLNRLQNKNQKMIDNAKKFYEGVKSKYGDTALKI